MSEIDVDETENASPAASTSIRAQLRTVQDRALTDTLLSTIIESTEAAIFVKDLDGRYLLINRQCELLFGLPRSAVVGKTDAEILPERTAELLRQNDRRTIEERRPIAHEEHLELPDGPHVFVSLKMPLWGPNGEPQAICGIATDITERKRMECALRESEGRFKALADAAPVLIWMSGSQKEGIYFNKTWLEFTGRPLEEQLGDGWLDLVHPDDLPALDACARAFKHQTPFQTEFRLRRADGVYRWVLDTGAPRFHDDGRFAGYVGSAVDFTDVRDAREALHQSEEQFRQAVGVAGLNVFHQDRSLRYTWAHSTAPGFDGRVGRRDDELDHVSGDFEGRLLEAKRRVLETGQRVHRIEADWVHGEQRFFELTFEPERDDAGSVVGLVGAVRDVTEHIHLEQELRQRNAEVAEADRRRDEFLAMLDHELRAPLAPIRTAVDLLRLRQEDPLAESPELAILDRQVAVLTRLVDDLVDVSRITRGQATLRIGDVQLTDLIDGARETVAPVLAKAGQELEVWQPSRAALRVDKVRIIQVLASLITNASRCSPSGSRIWLDAWVEGEQLILRVRDTGIGIEPSMLDAIFQPFVQAGQASDHASGGLGLGLTVVKQLVAMHGGSIDVTSAGRGAGSQFTVRVPVSARGVP